MTTPKPARQWVTAVVVAAVVGVLLSANTLATSPLDPVVASVLVVGVVLATLLPIRYRFGGSTHAVTVDEPFLLAMLVALPPAWPPVLVAGGVAVGNLARRRPKPIPLIRVAFNSGSVALSAVAAAHAHQWVAGDADLFTARGLAAVVAAMLAHVVVSTMLIGVLFQRLGLSSFRESVADVIAVGRLPYPLHVIGGIVLGWLSIQGAEIAVLGVGVVVAIFVAYRAAVAVRAQRIRAARLRDVAMALVSASGSMDAFDVALSHIAELFGAKIAELHVMGQAPRWIASDGSRGAAVGPTRAAAHGLTLERAASLAPGSTTGGPDGALVAPLRDEEGIVGVLALHARAGLEHWEEADEDVLDGVAGEILVALRNAELVEQIAGERSRLAAQSSLLGGIIDAVSDGIAMVDSAGEVLAWNPGMSTVAGIGASGAVGRQWADLVEATDEHGSAEAVAADLEQALAGKAIARTWQISPPVGDERWVRIVLTPVTDPDRPGVVVVARDVTATREVDRVKADFIATVSHELRTPLTPLKGFLELADKRQLSEEVQAEMRVSMRRQISRLEALVDDLLAMAELDRDLVDLDVTALSLGPALAQVPDAFAGAGAERVRVEPTDLAAMGDEESVRRILTALVSNALKHTSGKVVVRAVAPDGAVWVEVEDEGPGIPIGDQEVIFQRFHRLGDHLHRTQGPGLGLPIARALARRLGGDVVVESGLNRGSVFRLVLAPVADDGASPVAG